MFTTKSIMFTTKSMIFTKESIDLNGNRYQTVVPERSLPAVRPPARE